MKSNICVLEGNETDVEHAIKEVELVFDYNKLSHKQSIQLQLLTEKIQ